MTDARSDPVAHRTEHRIGVGIDGSEASRQALQWAIEEGRRHDVYVGGGTPYAAHALIDGVVDAADASGLASSVHRTVVQDAPAHALVGAAKGADLVVNGSRGRGGFAGLLLRSVGQQVVHHAPCPVVAIPPTIDERNSKKREDEQ